MSGTSSAKSRLTALKADVPAARKTRRAKNPTVALGPRFEKALLFAKRQHAGQTRKETTVPYLAHLLAVASLVLEAGGEEDMAIAGLLHDVVEDCGGAPMLREVNQRFGPEVARMVEGCTDSFTLPKLPWRYRKEEYLRRLQGKDRQTRLVSSADKLHNARSILSDYRVHGERVWERFAGKREGTLWYYRALLDEFQRHGPARLTDELELVVKELERLTSRAISAPSKSESIAKAKRRSAAR